MASSGLYEEIGRLKQRVDYLRGENTVLREKNETLDEANMGMHDELAKANRALRRDGMEKARLHDDIRRLNEELEMQNEEIERLHDQLAKAQRTIKVQSDQIAAPSEKKNRWTPSRATPSSRPDVDFTKPPPPFQLPQRRPSSVHPPEQTPQTGYFPASLAQPSYPRPKTSQSGYPPPPRAQPSSYPQHSSQSSTMSQSVFLPPQRSLISPPYHQDQQEDSQHQYQHQYQHVATPVRHSIAPPWTEGGPNPATGGPSERVMRLPRRSSGEQEVYKFLTPSGTIVETQREEGVMSLLPDLSPLFFQGETWARRHCGVPSKAGDATIPLALKDRIASMTNPSEVQALLSKGPSRPLVVAKIINFEITTTCLRPSVINGFRPSVDQKLEDIRSQNSAVLAINFRRGILVAAAEIIQEAVKDPRFESWVDRQADQNTAKTWTTIGALCVANTHEVEAQAELKTIWLEAYRVGVKMACKPSIFTTDFPPTGPQSVFNPAKMVNKDYGYGISGTELARRGSTVRLAVTPVVMETDFSGKLGSDRLEPRCLHFSNCLLAYR